MIREFYELISGWMVLDTWIVVIGALAAMSCALPGTWLLLRRQSLLGDALSHSILPGIVLAYLGMHWLRISDDSGFRHLILFLGAATSGVTSAVLTELLQRWGRLDRGAAIGVVFTSMFALGLMLIQMFLGEVHIHADNVLSGGIEQSVFLVVSKSIPIPQAVVINGAMLAINGLFVILFFKELRLSTFDPGLAGAVGLNANWIQLALMVMTAATIVAAFESVGAILVVAMLIVPPAAARLLTDRLETMLVISLVIASLSAIFGHIGALTVPPMVFGRLGYPDVHDASTAGMMAVASGCFFVLAVVGSPRHGSVRYLVDRIRLRIRIAGEDILGAFYRRDEVLELPSSNQPATDIASSPSTGLSRNWLQWFAQRRLYQRGLITEASSNSRLTDKGRELARSLVRSHRLWEAYMARHFNLPGDHLHATAEEVEHFLSPALQTELAAELDQPNIDPHGKEIP